MSDLTHEPSRRAALGLAAAVGGAALAATPATSAAQASRPQGRVGLTAQDRLDVLDLLARYAWYLDTHQGEKWAALFAPGGRAVFSWTVDTPEKLIAYAKNTMAVEQRQHHVGTIMIDADEGGQSCTVRSYLTTTLSSPLGNLHAFLATGCYVDKCVKLDGAWYFMERRFFPWNATLR